jgi:hypothetical protein
VVGSCNRERTTVSVGMSEDETVIVSGIVTGVVTGIKNTIGTDVGDAEEEEEVLEDIDGDKKAEESDGNGAGGVYTLDGSIVGVDGVYAFVGLLENEEKEPVSDGD